MNKWIDYGLLIVTVLACFASAFSLWAYAFRGVSLWTPLAGAEDGGVRFVLLVFFHVIPFALLCFWTTPRGQR